MIAEIAQTTLGERVRAARKAKGLTQQRLGNALGVTQGQIANIENDLNPPSTRLLKRLCLELDVSSDLLLFGDDPPGQDCF
jgi:transcriptional regulator with XRE-family HTH domain